MGDSSNLETSDGGFIMSGYSGCSTGVNTLKIDATGAIVWSKNYDGLYNNTRIEPTSDNGYVMLTWDATDDFGYDMRLVKTDEDGISGCSESTLSITEDYTSGLVQSGTVMIDNCPWEIVDPETLTGIAFYLDSTECISCDGIIADFESTTEYVTIEFTDLSVPSTNWSWDFGDGGTSLEQNPVHAYDGSGTYTVCLVASNPLCGDDEICKEITVETDQTGIEELDDQNIAVFPNPTTDQITFQSSIENEIKHVRISSLSGQVILIHNHIHSNTISINLQDLPQGIYIAEIETTDTLSVRKIIKQ